MIMCVCVCMCPHHKSANPTIIILARQRLQELQRARVKPRRTRRSPRILRHHTRRRHRKDILQAFGQLQRRRRQHAQRPHRAAGQAAAAPVAAAGAGAGRRRHGFRVERRDW